MTTPLQSDMREYIAQRVAHEFSDGEVVTLGIGLPTHVVRYLPPNIHIMIQAENGIVGCGPQVGAPVGMPHVTDAGGNAVQIADGGAFCDSSMSFAIIRGGHIDKTVLGALQVDQKGNLANYMIPGKLVPGMGGAMDLTVGAKYVIIAMEHCAKDGSPKILSECTLPLTAAGVVNLVITEKAVLKVLPDGLHLIEVSPYSTINDIVTHTACDLIIDV